MNKIGFLINRIMQGPKVMLTVNDGEWTKKVIDPRDILGLYGLSEVTKYAMFMSFSDSGTYICVARPLYGRALDNIAGWLFIPNSVDVNGDELISMLKVVKDELSSPIINNEKLTDLFNTEFRSIEDAASYLPSASDGGYAKRVVGAAPYTYSLKDIIGKYRYQPEYTKYSAILIDTEDGLEIVERNVTDLSNGMMKELFVFCPPSAIDIPSGVSVYIKEGGEQPFNKPILVPKSTTFDIIFKRSGFENIPYKFTVEENGHICGVPKVFKWNFVVYRDMFNIVSAQSAAKSLNANAKIMVNGKELLDNRPVTISEKEAANAEIKVSLNGYETVITHKNLLNFAGKIKIELSHSEEARVYTVTLRNGHTAEMTLKSTNLPSKSESPLEGYSVGEWNKNKIELEYTNFGVLKQRAIGFLAAVGVFIVISIGIALWDWWDSTNFKWQGSWPFLTTEKVAGPNTNSNSNVGQQSQNIQQVSTPPSSPQPKKEQPKTTTKPDETIKSNPALAIKYLDNDKQVWTKAELDSYPELKGMFEELNSYDVEALKKRYQLVKSSTAFSTLINAINDNPRYRPKGTYNNPGDTRITVTNYIKQFKTSTPHTGANASKTSQQSRERPQSNQSSNQESSEFGSLL